MGPWNLQKKSLMSSWKMSLCQSGLQSFDLEPGKRGPKNNNNLGKGRSGGRPKPKSFDEVEKEFDILIEDEAETSVADSDSY